MSKPRELLNIAYDNGHNDGVRFGKEELLDYLTIKVDGLIEKNKGNPETLMAFCYVMTIIQELQEQIKEGKNE